MERFAIHLVTLNPTTGAETAKTRPCVIVSPGELYKGGHFTGGLSKGDPSAFSPSQVSR